MAGSTRLFILASLVMILLMTGIPAAESATVDLMGYAWNKEEITIAIKPAKAVKFEAISDVRQAIEDWNSLLAGVENAPRFIVVDDEISADIIIHMKMGGGNVLGYTLLKTVKGYGCILQKASIQLSGKGLGEKVSRVGTINIARHELGHVVGLGHSDDPEDLMYPTAEPWEVWGTQNVPITALDVAGVAAIYPVPQHCEIPESVTTDRSTLTFSEAFSEGHFSGDE